ncbi:DUF488 family protein [Novosphingobium album (ex Liu et al. 2023)]|uniref:DUF488 domain-containing protein n=1 Tax=Novosphingobium album (ex Liu et al. 2023) TaxID=3031130 RepID=A0ABT5WRX8_9SPHN|nr:DUF488 domain-containing protein [Novosphingobium album (ex Liu et al. 2023)]MDE8652801.1 DUF488 domain-containing protein [Novosphingobium album (ex Liu et al. 2023)]
MTHKTRGSDRSAANGNPTFTIGHSTKSIADFVELLRVGQIAAVVDVRSLSRSRANPQYNRDSLPAALAACQIGYDQIPELGGLRKKSRTIPPEVNGFWINQSFHNYADYALSGEFRAGLDRLLELAASRRCAIMCAEAVWWRCHRRIIADYLLHLDRAVFHLMGTSKAEPATMTAAARAGASGLVYPAVQKG